MDKKNQTEQTLLKTSLSNRVYGLDILRFIGIMAVMLGHIEGYTPEYLLYVNYLFPVNGVTVFFVLSGFLIGRILIRSFETDGITKKTVLKFWINRWMRTAPPYMFTLTLLLVICLLFGLEMSPWLNGTSTVKILSYYLFLQNLFYIHFGFFPESWSLTVEEWFYLLIPLVSAGIHFIFKRKMKTTLIITSILFILLPLFIRIFKYFHLGFDNIEVYPYLVKDIGVHFYTQVITRLDSIGYGIVGAILYMYYQQFWNKSVRLAFVIGVILLICSVYLTTTTSILYQSIFYFVLQSLIPLMFLPFLASLKKGKGIIYKFITYISLISYSLYLFHFTLIQYIIIDTWLVNIDPTAKFIVFWVLSLGLATLSYLFIERPCINSRKRVLSFFKL